VKRKLLTLWNSASFFCTYARIEGFAPRYDDLGGTLVETELRPLDRWLLARTQVFLADAEQAYEGFMTVGVARAFEAFVDDLSNWYIRRSRRRFYGLDEAAFRTLWTALVQALRVVSPIMPFLADHLWRILVARACPGAPESVFLAGWPTPSPALEDAGLVSEVASARQAIELGRAARQNARIKLRQPLRRVVICTLDPEARAAVSRQVEDVGGELNVKEVEIRDSPEEIAELRAAPRLDLVGPRFGPQLPELRRLLAAGEFALEDGKLVAGPFTLVAGEYALEYVPAEGWALAQDADYVVAVDTRVDDELALEGRALDVIHEIQRLRKGAGLEITDRIEIGWDGDGLEEVFAAHGERIARETLAVRVERRPGEGLSVRKAG
jgi:isoleucyl-tRNA synthetase